MVNICRNYSLYYIYINNVALRSNSSQRNFPSARNLDNRKLLSRNYKFNFRATFSPAKAQFPVSGISRAGGILDSEKLLSRNYLFNFRETFSPANNGISARSENSTDWKLALTKEFPPARKNALTGNQPLDRNALL